MPDALEAYAETAPDPADKGRGRKTLGKLADLLDRQGIPVEEIGRVQRVNSWQGFYKDKEGEAHTIDMVGIALTPNWAEGPSWPVVQPGPRVAVRAPKAWKPADRDHLVCVELPDIQAGFWRGRDGQLHPTHDDRAIDVVLEVIRLTKPDVVVVGGDGVDLPELGKYRLTPAFQRTTQATVDWLTVFAARLRGAAGPECEIVWVPGNHEERMPNYILDNAAAAFGLRRGGHPESWPVLTVPFLCGFDEQGIRWVPGWPANEYWINDRLRVVHGNRVRSGGSTAHTYLAEERVSTIFNHVHRREWAERTRHTRYGPRTILAMSAGCLCRIDGSVPSTKGGKNEDGEPIPATEDWQQGVVVVTYTPGDSPFGAELVPIHDGVGWFRGRELAPHHDKEHT
jgi:hypothetical protein